MPEYRRAHSPILFTIQITFSHFSILFPLKIFFNRDVNEAKSFWLNTSTLFSFQMMQTQCDTTESKSKCLNILILSENVPILMMLSRIYAEPDNKREWKVVRRKKQQQFFAKEKVRLCRCYLRTMTLHEILVLIKINANKWYLNGWWKVSVHLKFDLLGKGVPLQRMSTFFNVLR